VAEGVRQAIDPDEWAERLAARLDHDLDVAAVARALREVLGELDEPAGEG
jgi:hypothetical protein